MYATLKLSKTGSIVPRSEPLLPWFFFFSRETVEWQNMRVCPLMCLISRRGGVTGDILYILHGGKGGNALWKHHLWVYFPNSRRGQWELKENCHTDTGKNKIKLLMHSFCVLYRHVWDGNVLLPAEIYINIYLVSTQNGSSALKFRSVFVSD